MESVEFQREASKAGGHWATLKEPQLGQFFGHAFGRRFLSCPGKIGRRILGLQVAPALERAARIRRRADQLGLKKDVAARPPLRVGFGLEVGNDLTRTYRTGNNPV